MKKSLLDDFGRYLKAQLALTEKRPRPQLPAVTISREAGAGAITIARLVAKILDQRCPGDPACPWAVFERNLVEKILQDHKLPAALERFMPEDAAFPLNDAVETLLGLHPSSWALVEHTTQTIRQLAIMGNVILIGRGSNIIAAHLPHVFNVRLVAPLRERVRRVEQYYQVKPAKAAQMVQDLDEARRRYLRQYFRTDIDDPLQYHLTINTGHTSFEKAARIIANLVIDN
jgi:cytidylate kinase